MTGQKIEHQIKERELVDYTEINEANGLNRSLRLKLLNPYRDNSRITITNY